MIRASESSTAAAPPQVNDWHDRSLLLEAVRQVRDFTTTLASRLQTEDYVVQSMPDVSPTRWHLAHTTWFFETFLLREHLAGYQPVDPAYEVLFNSYYNTVGAQFPHARRGVLSRPTVAEVYDYRARVDDALLTFLASLDEPTYARLAPVVLVGLHHEQQHQELLLTDIKHVFTQNPLWPVYEPGLLPESPAAPLTWIGFDEGLIEIGQQGDAFAFDNESPRHRTFVEAYELASRCVTNGEYLQFIEAGGYDTPQLWLSLGWDAVRANQWSAPLYWVRQPDGWYEFTLHGLVPLDPERPAVHLSYFEADACARWSGYRLPTEAEWEHAASTQRIVGNCLESGAFHPLAAEGSGLTQLFGDVWEWTASSYAAYPGYITPPGAIGEYNGKFMCGQYVLRGGSCATSASHLRVTYRNFFPPEARWQFAGVRLARMRA